MAEYNIYVVKDNKTVIYVGYTTKDVNKIIGGLQLPHNYNKNKLTVKKVDEKTSKADASLEVNYLTFEYKAKGEAVVNGRPGLERPSTRTLNVQRVVEDEELTPEEQIITDRKSRRVRNKKNSNIMKTFLGKLIHKLFGNKDLS